jgi:toxin ParE1/3/4
VSVRPVIPRRQAERDVEVAVGHYLEAAGAKAALGFIDALQVVYAHIARHPTSGSPRYAHELGLPGLRFRLLKRYPYMVFYVDRDDHIDVWRVLHGERDIPEWMREPGHD